MNSVIEEYKYNIRKTLMGYDTTLRLKGSNSFVSLLTAIDKNTALTEEELKFKFSIVYNLCIVSLQRKKLTKQINWLTGNSGEILKFLYSYLNFNSHIYKVDDSLISWYKTSHSNLEDYTHLNNLDLGMFHFMHNNFLYIVTRFKNKENIELLEISTFVFHNQATLKESSSYVYDVEITNSDKLLEDRYKDLKSICSTKKCPRYKQSMSPVYNDNGRVVNCDDSDCDKCLCGSFSDGTLLRPNDALIVVKAIYECVSERKKSSNSTSIKKEYEPIPIPECDDDVVVYFNTKKKSKSLEELGLLSLEEGYTGKCGIVSSHASPREHERVSHTRTLKSGKETKVKGSTVNKGKTKTTYVLRESKCK